MTDCNWRMNVQAYHDGELPPAARKELEAHVLACPACADDLKALRAMSALLASAPLTEWSPAARERLLQRTTVPPERALARTSEWFAAAAALILLLSGAWLWHAARAPMDKAAFSWDTAVESFRAEAPPADPETHLAQWIVADLSQGNRHE